MTAFFISVVESMERFHTLFLMHEKELIINERNLQSGKTGQNRLG